MFVSVQTPVQLLYQVQISTWQLVILRVQLALAQMQLLLARLRARVVLAQGLSPLVSEQVLLVCAKIRLPSEHVLDKLDKSVIL